jgi:phosphotransferase system IIB component
MHCITQLRFTLKDESIINDKVVKVNGVILALFETKYAIGIILDDGVEILIHI